MPLTYRYDPEARLLHGRGWGRVSGEDLVAGGLPDYPVGTPEVIDLREVTEIAVEPRHVRRLADQESSAENRISRMAIVVDGPLAFGLSRMFQTLADEVSYEIEVFRDMSDALAWLDRVPKD